MLCSSIEAHRRQSEAPNRNRRWTPMEAGDMRSETEPAGHWRRSPWPGFGSASAFIGVNRRFLSSWGSWSLGCLRHLNGYGGPSVFSDESRLSLRFTPPYENQGVACLLSGKAWPDRENSGYAGAKRRERPLPENRSPGLYRHVQNDRLTWGRGKEYPPARP